jgi:hypothetical protein
VNAQRQSNIGSRLPWILLALVITAWGWQYFASSWSSPNERVVTSENYSVLRSEVQNDTAMSDIDKRAFLSASGYEKNIQPYGKTIGQVIKESKAKDLADQQAAEEQTNAKRELANDIVIRPYSLTVKKGRSDIVPSMDDPWKDIDEIEFSVVNKGP